MSNSFSERQGIIKPATLDPKDMPIELRNRIWNAVKVYVDNGFRARSGDRDAIIELLWDNFFKQDKDNLRKWDSYR